VKKSPEMWPNQFLVKINTQLSPWKKKPYYLGYFCNFHKTNQSNQSPNRRKFAQSGHPGTKTIL
jgi:hypothetical protein